MNEISTKMLRYNILYIWIHTINLFPGGEFLRTHHFGSPWFEWLSSPWFILWNFLPLRFVVFIWWVVGGWWAYFWVNFWLFSKLFGSCFKIVWALFLDSESPYLRVLSAQKKIWWQPKSRFSLKFWPPCHGPFNHFWPFSGSKKSFSGPFESWFGVVWASF